MASFNHIRPHSRTHLIWSPIITRITYWTLKSLVPEDKSGPGFSADVNSHFDLLYSMVRLARTFQSSQKICTLIVSLCDLRHWMDLWHEMMIRPLSRVMITPLLLLQSTCNGNSSASTWMRLVLIWSLIERGWSWCLLGFPPAKDPYSPNKGGVLESSLYCELPSLAMAQW